MISICSNILFRLRTASVLVLSLFIFTLNVNTGLAGKTARPKIPTGSFGCTNSVKKFDKWSKGYEHAAVAIAKAKTITGSRGCGWAWNQTSKQAAERKAVANCRKHAFHPETCIAVKSN